jgi:hypothetical protein
MAASAFVIVCTLMGLKIALMYKENLQLVYPLL